MSTVACLGSANTTAWADAAKADSADRAWHAGVNVRSDFGTHPLRVTGGVRWGRIDTSIVVDPIVFSDGEHALDLAGEWLSPKADWGLMFGWRATSIAISSGHQWQQKVLVGVSAALPSLFGGQIRGRLGIEMAILMAKHGGGLPSDFFSLQVGVNERFHTGLFLRFEYASAL